MGKAHGDPFGFGDFHSANSPPADQPVVNSAQSAHSHDPFDFLGPDKPPNSRQRSQTESATQNNRPNSGWVQQSNSSRTPPVGSIAKVDSKSQKENKQVANKVLSDEEKERARI